MPEGSPHHTGQKSTNETNTDDGNKKARYASRPVNPEINQEVFFPVVCNQQNQADQAAIDMNTYFVLNKYVTLNKYPYRQDGRQ
ncbi:MAG: hypothetical protein ACYSN9_01885 [Planctomycetota bacterium]